MIQSYKPVDINDKYYKNKTNKWVKEKYSKKENRSSSIFLPRNGSTISHLAQRGISSNISSIEKRKACTSATSTEMLTFQKDLLS